MERVILAIIFLLSSTIAQELPCGWETESVDRRLVPYISGPIFTLSNVVDLVSCQSSCVESSSFICAAVNYQSSTRICQLLEENDQTATPETASSWQYSLRPICAGMWQPWTATKGMYLHTGVTKFDLQNAEDLRSCMTRCIQDNVNTTSTDHRCRSVVKSIVSPGVCNLVDKRSDDDGIVSEANTTYQYFDRPQWYTDNAPGSTMSPIVEYSPRGSAPTIFIAQKIKSDGYIVAWQYYLGQKVNPCKSYAGVWRQEGHETTYKLIMETLLSPSNVQSGGVRFQYITDRAERVRKDDVISTYVRSKDCSGTLVSFNSITGTSRYGDANDIENISVGGHWNTKYAETRQAALRPFIAEYLTVSNIMMSYGDDVNENQVKITWDAPQGIHDQNITGGGYSVDCSEANFGEVVECSSRFIPLRSGPTFGERSIVLQLNSSKKVYYARVQVARNLNGNLIKDETQKISNAFCSKRGLLKADDVIISETGLLRPDIKRTITVHIPSLSNIDDPCVTSVMINGMNTMRLAERSFEGSQGEELPITVRVNITGGLSQIVWTETHHTKQVPPAPRSLSASLRMTNSTLLTWDRINGYEDSEITKYQVECSVTNTSFSSNEQVSDTSYNATETESTLTAHRLHPQVQYSCNVKALLKDGGYGHSSEPEVFWTKPSYPDIAINTDDLPAEVDSGEVMIKLPQPADARFNELFNKVVIVVSKVSDGSRKRRSLTDLPIDGSNTYKTAEFPLRDSNETFTIGDGHRYGRYDNKKLDIGSYQFYIGYQAFTEDNVEQFYQITSQPIRVEYPTEPPPPTTTADGETGGMSSLVTTMIAAAVGVVVVTIFVIGGLVMYRRRKRNSDDSSPTRDLATTNIDSEASRYGDPVAAKRPIVANKPQVSEKPKPQNGTSKIKEATAPPTPARRAPINEESDTYENFGSSLPDSNDIPVSELHKVIRDEKESNPTNPFKEEFNKIGSPAVTCKIGRIRNNVVKNRFKNITATDQNRVVLEIEGYDSDYVNANYIKDYNGKSRFIAAQGPNDGTVEDMWRTIHDTKSSTIVMLANPIENGKAKCSVYWPETTSEQRTIGQFTITLLEEHVFAEYVVRKLKYVHNKKARHVKHFHFTQWPDHGVPTSSGLLSFRYRVKQDMSTHKSPVIVHCSAGVGRTGTFIGLDLLIDEAHDQQRAGRKTVNVMRCVYNMRLQRTQMVQTADQYAFLYDIVSEALTCGDTVLESSRFSQLVHEWKEKRRDKKSILQDQYEKIGLTSPTIRPNAYSNGMLEPNHNKNREQSILPLDKYRVILKGKSPPTDYINAVTVDSYEKLEGFIATQAPLRNTRGDFWRLIVETKSSVIVYLNDCQDEEDYWPTESGAHMSYADVEVECQSTNKITDRCFEGVKATESTLICKTPQKKSALSHVNDTNAPWINHGVKHIEVKTGSRLPTPDQLVSLCTMLEKYATSGSDVITVQCRDGSRLTGILIVALNLYLRTRIEQEVDIVLEVKLASRNRPHFISDYKTFEFLYEFVSSYLSDFSDYSNFR